MFNVVGVVTRYMNIYNIYEDSKINKLFRPSTDYSKFIWVTCGTLITLDEMQKN